MVLEEFRKYENLGTPTYFWILFQKLRGNTIWTEKDVSKYFVNKIIDGKSVFDGCIPLLKKLKIIHFNKHKHINLRYPYKYITQFNLLNQKLLEDVLLFLKEDNDFLKILASDDMFYDFTNKKIAMKSSIFGFKYANLRNLLIDFNFLIPCKKDFFIVLEINQKWKSYFERHFIYKIRSKKTSLEDLLRQQIAQQKNGEIAERFVLNFEKIRLNNKIGIQWIAPYDVNAGFDILSFKKEISTDNDCYIEVKSYSGLYPYFYWTKNEILQAEKNYNKYFIYLVNRDKIHDSNYQPQIIENPIINILNNNDWKKETDKYYITSQIEDKSNSLF